MLKQSLKIKQSSRFNKSIEKVKWNNNKITSIQRTKKKGTIYGTN